MAQFGRTDWRQRYNDFRQQQAQNRGLLDTGELQRDATPQRDERYNVGTSPPPGAMRVSESIWRGQDGFYYRRDPSTGNFYAAVSGDGEGEYAIDRQNWEQLYPGAGNGTPPNWQSPQPGVDTPATPITPPQTGGGGGLPVTGSPGAGGGGGLPPSGDSGGTGRPPIPDAPVLRPPTGAERPPRGDGGDYQVPRPGVDPGRGSLPGGPYAAFGFAPGPAGGLLPIMLQQGANPFQNAQPGAGQIPQNIAPTQLAQALYNPDIQGYQWFTPPPPPEPGQEGTTPSTSPNTGGGGGGGYGDPDYRGAYDPATGRYYQLPKLGGLLGLPQTPAALKGLLG